MSGEVTIEGILTHKVAAKAYLEGKQIQLKSVIDGYWYNIPYPNFREFMEYRVKPTQEDSST